MILAVAGFAASELSMRREVLDLEDDPDILAALACWDGARFVLRGDRDAVWRGLVTLANGCDEDAERRSEHPETRRFSRYARDGLSSLASKVLHAHQ